MSLSNPMPPQPVEGVVYRYSRSGLLWGLVRQLWRVLVGGAFLAISVFIWSSLENWFLYVSLGLFVLACGLLWLFTSIIQIHRYWASLRSGTQLILGQDRLQLVVGENEVFYEIPYSNISAALTLPGGLGLRLIDPMAYEMQRPELAMLRKACKPLMVDVLIAGPFEQSDDVILQELLRRHEATSTEPEA